MQHQLSSIITMISVSVSLLLIGVLGINHAALAHDHQQSKLLETVKQTMASPLRTEKEKARDKNRQPLQALAFWGMQEDMKVIEFVPGRGWYTKLLAPALRDNGELILVSADRYLSYLDGFLNQAPYDKVKKAPIEMSWDAKQRRYALGSVNFGVTDADMVINIREYHNFNLEDKAKLNQAAFKALKPEGTYVVVDHSRRHMSPEIAELRRREDPVKVILEVQAAGFRLVDSSDMFYRPDDELIYEVGRRSVTGNTDRFTLIFKKPKR